jgi:hypothetical protein
MHARCWHGTKAIALDYRTWFGSRYRYHGCIFTGAVVIDFNPNGHFVSAQQTSAAEGYVSSKDQSRNQQRWARRDLLKWVASLSVASGEIVNAAKYYSQL